ncbi:MAG: CRISPR-associated helicase Cas3' [Gammaproteobacteria bacterium]
MSQPQEYLAHTHPDGRTHALAAHLRKVAELAACHAQAFGSEDWAKLAGLWHDLGKYRPAFQRYIKQSNDKNEAHIEGVAKGRVEHSAAGAVYAEKMLGEQHGRILAYLIAGHHAGLPDYEPDEYSRGALKARLAKAKQERHLEEAFSAAIPDDVRVAKAPTSPVLGGTEGFHLWVRMLFSCLVDADFLDTEAFMDDQRAALRSDYPNLTALLQQFNHYMAAFAAPQVIKPVDHIRQQVLQHCRDAAQQAPGLFSLTVPTGGGKTLSSLAFALEHAKQYGKQRVIYAIPYTSIIEQTAEVFREVFAPLGDIVIEHHSQADVDSSQETSKSRLACENWDAPLIVTTNVQFFESLYAARTSRCRKLHNIVNSVVILDEAQMLPPEYLQTITHTIDLLRKYYGVSFVFCTATQPELGQQRQLGRVFKGLETQEIIPEPTALYQSLRRVTVELPRDYSSPLTWPDLAAELSEHEQVLCIVNGARKDARELFRLMPEGTYHLSALMCGQHRSDQLAEIRARLERGDPVRIVSTPLIEAGVDISLPVVYRAFSGLDSIAQAAGRCNRHGELPELGKVKIFLAPGATGPGKLARMRASSAQEVLHGFSGDPLLPALFKRYFELLYGSVDIDTKDISKLVRLDDRTLGLSFRTLASRFKLIDDEDQHTVFVCYREGEHWIETLRNKGPERWLLRKLQRFSVSIYENEFNRLLHDGVIESVHGYFVQKTAGIYNEKIGLSLDFSYAADALIL